MKRPVGRPPIIASPEEFDRLTVEYFNLCEQKKQVPTTVGLALHLGFEGRQSLYDYGARKDFSYTVKRAIGRIESFHEARLTENICAGSIFWLKNHRWSDRQDHVVQGGDTPIKVDASIEIVLRRPDDGNHKDP